MLKETYFSCKKKEWYNVSRTKAGWFQKQYSDGIRKQEKLFPRPGKVLWKEEEEPSKWPNNLWFMRCDTQMWYLEK